MDVYIYQLSGESSISVNVTCAGCTITVINKKVSPTFLSTNSSLAISKDKKYLCIYTRDYRNNMSITANNISCSNLRSGFGSTEALYGVYGTWYCHNCATICALENSTISVAADLILWLQI